MSPLPPWRPALSAVGSVERVFKVTRALLLTAAAAFATVSCLDQELVAGLRDTATEGPTQEPTASNPIAAPPAAIGGGAGGLSASVTAGPELAYVSLPPGTVPDGGLATITNSRLVVDMVVPMQDGGFDPVSIAAAAGDVLQIAVQQTGGAVASLTLTVPRTARPKVVRANPPPRKRDVPLNTQIVVVFSEPILSGTETGIGVRLNSTRIGASVALSADGLRVEIRPTDVLAPNTEYEVVVPVSVRDLSGEALADMVTSTFTTGTKQIVASVATDPAALVANPFNGELRTFTMTATRDNDGVYSGSFSIFYPGPVSWRQFGSVKCFAIVDGNQAWIAGVVEGATDTLTIGLEYGWRANDNSTAGRPDELSLAIPLLADSLGTALDFCANTPVVIPFDGDIQNQPIELVPVTSGDVVINSHGPPPPPATGMSEIAFAAWPGGGIQVIRADGTAGRRLTTDSGDFSPSWSPDGTKLAFDRNRGDLFSGDIYVINADGSGLTRLTSDGWDDSDPAWSPDGRRIAFSRDGAIYLINPDGSGRQSLTGHTCNYHPTWSPTGSQIAFASCQNGTNAVFVMNSDGSGAKQITFDPAGAWAPWWSPDGHRIVFQRFPCCTYHSIYSVKPDGSGLTQVVVQGRTPSWSPDSRAVVFEQFGLNVVRADGTGLHSLGPGYDPAWSPAGTVPAMAPLAAAVSIDLPLDTLAIGGTTVLTAIGRDADGNVMPGRLAAWTNSNSTVATITAGFGATRMLTALANGVTRITATIDGKSDTVVVVVGLEVP